jgi:homocysteine S-methyltransferase
MHQHAAVLPQLKGRMFMADGGIETHLIFNMGQDLPNFSAFILADSEDGRATLRKYFRDYLPIAKKTGVGFVFDTPTWRASGDWGALAGYDAAKLRAVNMASIALCQELAAEFKAEGIPTIVSGAIGPRRDGWKYDGGMTVAEAEAYHRPQIEAFRDAGADYVTVYTLTNTSEAIGISKAAESLGIPAVVSFTLETDGNLPGGKPLGQAIEETDAATQGYPAYYMINCAHPIHFAATVREGGRWVSRIGGIRANASTRSHAELDEAPELDIGDIRDLALRYGRLMPNLPNIAVLGGCCGTDHRHIGAICAHVLPPLAS